MTNLIIACDHRGVDLKNHLLSEYTGAVNCGTDSKDSVDYPVVVSRFAEEFSKDLKRSGILICGSGIGVSIAANRFSFIRAVVAHNQDIARIARLHNDANVLCLPADFVSNDEARKIIDTFLYTNFSGGHHAQRIEQLSQMGGGAND